METKPEFAIVYDNGNYAALVIKNITRLQSDNGYTDIFSENRKTVTSCNSLRHCQQRLEKYGFWRVHGSHAINLNKVDKIEIKKKCTAILEDSTQVPVSRRLKAGFLSQFVVL